MGTRTEMTALKVAALKEPGRYAIGLGLYAVVDKRGGRYWVLRTMVQGRRTDVGLGGLATKPLADARREAAEFRAIAKAGGNPIDAKRAKAAFVPTFRSAAEAAHERIGESWRNAKHRQQWINTLKTYAYPTLETRRVDGIEAADILKLLNPIWRSKPETARRVTQRLAAVFEWCQVNGYRKTENPMIGIRRGLPKHTDVKRHHAAMPYLDVPAFLPSLKSTAASQTTKLALEFCILTAARTGEVLGAVWTEFDIENELWTIPASRMKKNREHRVPLSKRALEILETLKNATSSIYVFAGATAERHLSNMALLMLLRRMNLSVTTHGFRSSFKTWAGECTDHPKDLVELALAHVNKDRVEAAYIRSDFLLKRRRLMSEWSNFVTSQSCNSSGSITYLGASAKVAGLAA